MTSEAEDQGLFGEKAAARLLKVSPRTLRRWRLDGKVGFHRMPGGRIRYSLDQLLEFRLACRVAATCPVA
jgi:excisionase family DNA binding protein